MKDCILFIGILSIISISKANICSERATWGNVCKSCSERIYCIQHADEWKEIDLGTCDEGFVCSNKTGTCVQSNEFCYTPATNKEFECKVEGIFPDPMNCKQFYVCFATWKETDPDYTLGALRFECPQGKMYSAKTQSCSLEEGKAKCTIPYCTRPGQQAAWPDDDEIFYICSPTSDGTKKELYPIMLRCSAGESFDGNRCVRGVTFTTSILKTTAKTTQDFVTVPTTPANKVICTEKGLRAHTSDCNKYFYCDAKLNPKEYNCPKNQIFSTKFRSCIKGSC